MSLKAGQLKSKAAEIRSARTYDEIIGEDVLKKLRRIELVKIRDYKKLLEIVEEALDSEREKIALLVEEKLPISPKLAALIRARKRQ